MNDRKQINSVVYLVGAWAIVLCAVLFEPRLGSARVLLPNQTMEFLRIVMAPKDGLRHVGWIFSIQPRSLRVVLIVTKMSVSCTQRYSPNQGRAELPVATSSRARLSEATQHALSLAISSVSS
jgi:hypothetical protein